MITMDIKLIATLTILLASSISGCLSEIDEESEMEDRLILINTQYWNDSHQFNNMIGGGYTNSTMMNLSGNGTTLFNINIQSYFFDAMVWKGHINLTIFETNNESNIMWSNESNKTGDSTYLWEYNDYTSPQNLTLRVRASGMDSEPDNPMADYFILTIISEEMQKRVVSV